MKIRTLFLASLLLSVLGVSLAFAQSATPRVVATCGAMTPFSNQNVGTNGTPTVDANGNSCGAAVSASIAGFNPTAGATATLSASGTSADVALPAGSDVVVTSPSTNTVPVFIRLQAGAGTAVATDMPISPGAAVGFHVLTATHISGITGGTAATLQIQGGVGLATGYGGGGSGSGSNGFVAQGSTTSGQTGPLVQCAVTTAAPSYTTAQTSPCSADTAGNIRDVEKNSAAVLAAIQAAVPAGGNVIGFVSNDPCSQGTKLGATINLTASGQLITGTAAKKTYICSYHFISATAQNIALVEGTGSVCATNIFGLAGGTTAATGWNLAANGGIAEGGGAGTVISPSADSNGTAANLCFLLSASGQTSGHITYVQQ